MERKVEKPSPIKLENVARHLANLGMYTGYWRGKFFWHGTPKPNSKTLVTKGNHRNMSL